MVQDRRFTVVSPSLRYCRTLHYVTWCAFLTILCHFKLTVWIFCRGNWRTWAFSCKTSGNISASLLQLLHFSKGGHNRLMSSWALLVCAVLFVCVFMPATQNPDLEKKKKNGEERGSESANSFFYSLFPISPSIALCLTGLTCLSLTVCLICRRRSGLEKKSVKERRNVSPNQHNTTLLLKPASSERLLLLCLSALQRLKSENWELSVRIKGWYKGKKPRVQWWIYNDCENLSMTRGYCCCSNL